MKKIALFSVLAGLMMTGCIEGDYGVKPAGPQGWEQEEMVTLPTEVDVKPVAAIDLAKVEEDSVAVATYSPVAVPEGTTTTLTVIVEKEYEFTVQEDMKLPVDELQEIVVEKFGKRPAERTLKAELMVNVYLGGQASLIGPAAFEVKVTPEAPEISSAYYLIGNMNDWNTDAAKNFKFKHSGKDVYEDPVFSITFKAGAACYWKILVQEGYDAGDPWKGALGVETNGDTALEGKLTGEDGFGAGQIAEAGNYVMTINMMDGTYKISPLASEYYLVGAVSGWNGDAASQFCLLYPQGNNVFTYTTKWTGDHNFKIWSGENAGKWDKTLGTGKDGDASPEGKLVENAGAICTPTGDEFYTVTFDLGAMSYKSEKLADQAPVEYQHVALVGGFNGWGGDLDLEQKAPHNWVLKNATFDAETELKFRANHAWDIDWGGSEDGIMLNDKNFGKGQAKGKNFKIAAGTYDVFFNDITLDYVFIQR